MSKKVKIEFWQKVKYYAEIEVTAEELEELKKADGGDVEKHLRIDGLHQESEIFHLLQDLAFEENECDWSDTIEDFELMTE